MWLCLCTFVEEEEVLSSEAGKLMRHKYMAAFSSPKIKSAFHPSIISIHEILHPTSSQDGYIYQSRGRGIWKFTGILLSFRQCHSRWPTSDKNLKDGFTLLTNINVIIRENNGEIDDGFPGLPDSDFFSLSEKISILHFHPKKPNIAALDRWWTLFKISHTWYKVKDDMSFWLSN